MKLIGKYDWLLIVFVGFLILITLLPFSNGSNYNAFVYINNEMTYKIDLTKDGTYLVKEHVVVEVKDKKIRMKESDCPQQLCVKMGWISTPGVPIVCIPNKVMIIIEADPNNLDYDVITQ
ncbi:MAG: NusG domain II-containing protein [Thermotogota bacterium]|nr:NusG domain II-containing protein [Thermotogota bacterium]